jgi:hypothetical protein
MSTHRLLASATKLAFAFSLLMAAVGCGSSPLANNGGAGSGGAAGDGGGGAGSDASDDGPPAFPCGSSSCVPGRQYCFGEEWNGTQKIGPECRALPTGCSTCACAQSDAESVSLSCKAAGTLTCINGGVVIDYNTTTPTLSLACNVP